MTPREIIRAEYGNSRNLMTPRVLGIGKLRDGAYELSRGTGIEGAPIWAVSVVRLRADGTTFRDLDASRLFHRQIEADRYVAQLRRARPSVG